MSPPIELRTRTPLGACYRSPLGAFGPGATVATVEAIVTFVAGFRAEIFAPPTSSPCQPPGYNISGSGPDFLYDFNFEKLTGVSFSGAEFLSLFTNTIWQGDVSGAQVTIGGTVLCSPSQVVWFPAANGFYSAYKPNTGKSYFLFEFSNPVGSLPFVAGENLSQVIE